MALTGTTLAAAMGASDVTMTVTSATGFAAKNLVRVDSEYFYVADGYVSGTLIPLRPRGAEGTSAKAHGLLAFVVTGLASDFPESQPGNYVQLPPTNPPVVTYSTSGAMALPVYDTIADINSTGGVVALTLANPATTINGTMLAIVSSSTAAHTVTYSTGFFGGSTADDVATFTGGLGASLTLRAFNGKWGVVGQSTNVTIA